MSAALRCMTTLDDAEYMRRIRNTLAMFMTVNTSRIAYRKQVSWFTTVYQPAHTANEMFGYLMVEHPDTSQAYVFGYGLITKRDGMFWVSGGLLEHMRGKGHGRYLFAGLSLKVLSFTDRCFLDVRESNTIASTLYSSMGYRVVERTNGIVRMVLEVL